MDIKGVSGMKTVKKVLSALVALSLLLTSVPAWTVQATDSETTIQSNVEEISVTGLVCESLEIIENTGGYYQYINDENGSYQYYYYDIQPTYTVTFSDGTVYRNQRYGLEHNGQYYCLNVTTDQAYHNVWSVGNHKAVAQMGDISCEFAINIIESPIQSITVYDLEIVENTNGSMMQEYTSESDECLEYYHYYVYPKFDIELKDGTVLKDQQHSITYNEEWYSLNVSTNQSYNNQWGLGAHTATASLMGYSTEFNVNIIESPVQSIVCDDLVIYEETDGYYETYYDSENNKQVRFRYNCYPSFSINFNDGTVLEEQRYGVDYKGYNYNMSIISDLNSVITGPGEYTAIAEVAGIQSTYKITVLESPIESITVDDVDVIEGTNGLYTTEYNPNTGSCEEYYCYTTDVKEVKIVFKDGTTTTTTYSGFEYQGEYYSLNISSNQGPHNEWGIGAHTVNVRAIGVETTYKINVIASPYVSFEILNVAPVMENENCQISGGEAIYDVPDFSYRVTLDDGSSFIGYYGVNCDRWCSEYHWCLESDHQFLRVSSNQYENPWTVGGDNYFTASYAGIKVDVKVELEESTPYEYYEENGEVFLTGCKECVDKLEVPSEIDGMPVVAVLGLGNAATTVKQVIIPDSVELLGDGVFSGWYASEIENIIIGSGVRYLDANMFGSSVADITVSENNAYYSSIDGVVFDKEGTTLVVYPCGKGTEYTVPANVVNIDIMFTGLYQHVTLDFENGSTAYIKEDGVLYAKNKTVIVSCDTSKSGKYMMPDSVTTIADWAFMDCTELTSVVVSKNVTTIAYQAFANCTSLQNVDLPTGLHTIERGAFGGCNSLETIELPETLETIVKEAFAGSGLKSVVIPDSVTEMGEYAFAGSQLSEVTIGNGLTTISKGTFEYTELSSIAIGGNVETIEGSAFASTPLEKVTFGNKVKIIGEDAFYRSKINELLLPDSVTCIGEEAFRGCLIKELTIPDSVTTIGCYAFQECEDLEKVTLGEGISSVQRCTFAYCTNLKKVYFENEAVKINEDAFMECPISDINMEHVQGSIGPGAFIGSCLTSLVLPEGVTEVVYGSFMNSTALVAIDVPTSLVHVGGTAFDNTAWIEAQADGPVYLEHILYKYKGSMPNNLELSVKNGTIVLTDNLFENNENLTNITLPEGLLTIGDGAFKGATGLEEISIPSTVNYIGDAAFYGTRLTEITIPKSVEHIGEKVFVASDITAVNVDPENQWYSSIDGVLFNKDCTELIWCPPRAESSYTVPRSVKYIAPNAFSHSGVEEIVVQSYYTEFGYKAYGYEEIPNALSHGQYLDCKIVCFENSLADAYARKNLIPVEIVEPTIEEVTVENVPEKVEYEYGEQLDATGLSLAVMYNDGSKEIITAGFAVGAFDSKVAGEQKVTVTYEGYTTEFAVYVKELVIQDGKVLVGDTKGRAGDTVEVKIAFEQAVNIKSIAIKDLVYDTSKLQLVSGAWDVDGVLADWNMEKQEGVLTFAGNTEVKQFFTFTFLILEGTQDGEIPVECQIVAKELIDNVGEADISITYDYGTVTVYSVISGDVDGNDITNSNDAIYLLYYVMMPERYPINQDCDFNGDGMVNSDDAIYLLYHVMMPDSYPLNI